jgi:hypothetical protein
MSLAARCAVSQQYMHNLQSGKRPRDSLAVAVFSVRPRPASIATYTRSPAASYDAVQFWQFSPSTHDGEIRESPRATTYVIYCHRA